MIKNFLLFFLPLCIVGFVSAGPAPTAGTYYPEWRAPSYMENICAVCQEDFNTTTGLVEIKLPCSHRFHKYCVANWIKQNQNCPSCRYNINTDFLNSVGISEMTEADKKAREITSTVDQCLDGLRSLGENTGGAQEFRLQQIAMNQIVKPLVEKSSEIKCNGDDERNENVIRDMVNQARVGFNSLLEGTAREQSTGCWQSGITCQDLNTTKNIVSAITGSDFFQNLIVSLAAPPKDDEIFYDANDDANDDAKGEEFDVSKDLD